MLESLGATFPEAYLSQIQDMDNVDAVYPIYSRTLYFGTGGKWMENFIALNGVTPAFLTDLRTYLEVEEGDFFGEEDRDKHVLVIGSAVAEGQDLVIEDSFDVSGQEFKVVGVLQPSGGFDDMIAYAPIEALQKVYGDEDEVTIVAVTVKDLDKAEETAQKINQEMEDASPPVMARTMEELADMMTDMISQARAIHISVASIALLIGVLFILSTMMMAVSERTKEIGTMRAIGTSRRTIFRLIVTESVIVGLIAGALGCLGGYALSKIITYAIAEFAGVAFIQTVVAPWIFGAGMLIALLIGALAGLYPAWRVSRLDIVESLRYE